MEEKERYEYYPKQNQLYDKINDELYCLGIKQDKTRLVHFLNLMNEDWRTLYERNKELKEENQQLRQSQKQLAIKELEELQKEFDYCPYSGDTIYVAEVYDKIFAKIQELGGGENVKN